MKESPNYGEYDDPNRYLATMDTKINIVKENPQKAATAIVDNVYYRHLDFNCYVGYQAFIMRLLPTSLVEFFENCGTSGIGPKI